MGLVVQQRKAGRVAGREGGEQEQCVESNAQGAMHGEHAQGWQKGTTCCPGCPMLCQILARVGSPLVSVAWIPLQAPGPCRKCLSRPQILTTG